MKTLNKLEEKIILRKAQIGDAEAFGEIYDLYVVRIFRFVYLKTSSKETAEDLTSEVFLKCWAFIKKRKENKKKEFIKGNKLGSFLYKIARNLIIDFYKKKQFPTVEIDEKLKDRLEDKKQSVLAEISAKQEVEELMKSLSKLKDGYREIIILRHVEDLSIKEIAEITGRSSSSVRVSLHRAVKALEKTMKALPPL
ncbi:MAG: RNA polymerase sigma factor [Patescibacteria group bacterium]|nr:RNA polymerase sigma factor [Patescibacteria group bacterium]